MSRQICVVGAGRWGKNHVRTLQGLGALGGVVETSAERREWLKEEFSGIKTFATLEEALKEDFDGFTVATPAETHFKVAEQILEAKKHVLVEKPIALHAFEARKLASLAKRNKCQLMVGHVLLFHPAIQKIKALIEEDKIGKLQYIYSNRLNLGTVRTEENILWSFAPHDISIFQYFIGEAPLRVDSKGGAFVQPHIHDSTMTFIEYPNNIKTHIFVSWLHPFKEHRMVIIGSKGMLSFEDSGAKEIFFYEKGIDWINGEPIKRDGPTETIPYEEKMPLTEELSYFIDRLDGSPIEISGSKSAIEVLDILEEASLALLDEAQEGPLAAAQASEDFFIHPSSAIGEDASVGKGTKIWHYSHVQGNAKIGENCSLGQNVYVAPNVKIGDNVKIQNNVSVYEGVELEDYVFCGPSMVFTNVLEPRSKYPQRGSEHYAKTLIKEGASMGANCTIVCGNTVGKSAFVAAGAVVASDVPDYALVVGVPAKVAGWVCECGERFSKIEKEATCARCSLEYTLDGQVLKLKSETNLGVEEKKVARV